MTRRELTDEQIEARMPKKAGRPAMPAAQAVAVVLNGEETAPEVAAVDGLAQLQASYGQERDLANQMLGQIQMSRAISKFTDVVSLQKLKYIKENKSYRALSGQKGIDRNGSEITDVGTWAGFCAALGVSASKIDEDLMLLDSGCICCTVRGDLTRSLSELFMRSLRRDEVGWKKWSPTDRVI